MADCLSAIHNTEPQVSPFPDRTNNRSDRHSYSEIVDCRQKQSVAGFTTESLANQLDHVLNRGSSVENRITDRNGDNGNV